MVSLTNRPVFESKEPILDSCSYIFYYTIKCPFFVVQELCTKAGSAVTLNLIDSISRSHVQIPVRSVKCDHAAVCDLKILLGMHLEATNFQCPHCVYVFFTVV